MPTALKYIVNESGQKIAVLVPFKVWEDLNSNFQRLQNKLAVFDSVTEGLKEVENLRGTIRKLQTLKDFLK